MDKHRLEHKQPQFRSITQEFLSSKLSREIHCPRCGVVVDFTRFVEWKGPDHFSCCHCERLISKKIILRAMSDLGIDETPRSS